MTTREKAVEQLARILHQDLERRKREATRADGFGVPDLNVVAAGILHDLRLVAVDQNLAEAVERSREELAGYPPGDLGYTARQHREEAATRIFADSMLAQLRGPR